MRPTGYSKVTYFGHPIRPMVVTYPVAVYTATLVVFIIAAAQGDPFWFWVAVVANSGGVIMAAVAALLGVVDWAVGIPNVSPAKGHGLRHMLLNVLALVLFVVHAVVHAGQWTAAHPDTGWGIVLALVGVVDTVGARFYGRTMIQTDHVGILLGGGHEQAEVVGTAGAPPRSGRPIGAP